MPIITPADLTTHVYAEVLSEITRNNDTIVTAAIDTAISEAKMYLSRYDLAALFGVEDKAPELADPLLCSLVKDVAIWHLMRLSNSGIDQSACRIAYKDAIATLKSIMEQQAEPEGWPYAPEQTATLQDSDTISWSSNPKRNNHY